MADARMCLPPRTGLSSMGAQRMFGGFMNSDLPGVL